MAAALSSNTVDLKSQATFAVHLGDSILAPAQATRYAGVRYNHRPLLKQASDVKASITQRKDAGESSLSLHTDDGDYAYKGQYVPEQQSYVLVLRGAGKDKEMVLERVDGTHSLNLVGTPLESDAAKLGIEHPHLPADSTESGDLFGDDDEEEPIDESNPFDFRRFLQAELEKPENTQPIHDPGHSTISTPLIRSTKAAAAKVPLPKKRKAQPTEKGNAKRVKAGQEPAVAAQPAKAKAKAAPPKIRVDRKASVRKASIDDSGELILEDETPVTSKAPKNAMAMALAGQLGGGPISLRSAASSPGRVASPVQEKEEEVREYEFEFGNSSSPEPDDQPSQRTRDGNDADLDGEDDDADVDDLELPSPAQKHRPSASAGVVLSQGEDEEDDMEKQLALAMAAEDNESEESEEE